MKLIELALTMAYDAKVNYADVFYQVRMWDNIIYNYLKNVTLLFRQRFVQIKTKSMQEHMLRNRFLESMIGLCL